MKSAYERVKEWRLQNPEKYHDQVRRYLEKNGSLLNERHRLQERLLRKEVLAHYSPKGIPQCSCPGCNETRIEFLGIDHINGGGNKERKKHPHTYRWIKQNNFPSGFRVLCHNCNLSLGFYGYCPHSEGELKRLEQSGPEKFSSDQIRSEKKKDSLI